MEMLLICLQSNAEQLQNAVFCCICICEKSSEVVELQNFALIRQIFLRCGRKMNLTYNHLVLNNLHLQKFQVQRIVQPMLFTILHCFSNSRMDTANIIIFLKLYLYCKIKSQLLFLRLPPETLCTGH